MDFCTRCPVFYLFLVYSDNSQLAVSAATEAKLNLPYSSKLAAVREGSECLDSARSASPTAGGGHHPRHVSFRRRVHPIQGLVQLIGNRDQRVNRIDSRPVISRIRHRQSQHLLTAGLARAQGS